MIFGAIGCISICRFALVSNLAFCRIDALFICMRLMLGVVCLIWYFAGLCDLLDLGLGFSLPVWSSLLFMLMLVCFALFCIATFRYMWFLLLLILLFGLMWLIWFVLGLFCFGWYGLFVVWLL